MLNCDFGASLLVRRVLTALDDVLGSSESPLEVKEPLALDFLPSTLIEELRVVKTGETLACHPFFSLLMDDAGLHKVQSITSQQQFVKHR